MESNHSSSSSTTQQIPGTFVVVHPDLLGLMTSAIAGNGFAVAPEDQLPLACTMTSPLAYRLGHSVGM